MDWDDAVLLQLRHRRMQMLAASRTFLASFLPNGSIGREIQAEQIAATTQAMRSVAALIVAILIVAPVLTWRHAYLPLVAAGALVVIVASLLGLRLPIRARPDRVARDVRTHAIVAFALGCGWAMMTAAMAVGAGAEGMVIVALLQATSICIGLLLYCNLPLGFPLFVVPIAAALVGELIAMRGPPALLAFLVPHTTSTKIGRAS